MGPGTAAVVDGKKRWKEAMEEAIEEVEGKEVMYGSEGRRQEKEAR